VKLRRGLVLAIAVACLGTLLAFPVAAHGWTAARLAVAASQEDRFWTYDFVSTRAIDWNCDWPVTIVFWGNANVDDIKAWFSSSLPITGNPMWAYVADERFRKRPCRWVSDTGAKSFDITFTESLHVRLYADADGRLTNGVWGDYVVATTHYDLNELAANPTFGYSEDAAAAIEAICVRAFGADAVVTDALPLWNVEPERVEQGATAKGGVESHVWQCDGFATMVEVP
jgi:hypothetical protein